MNKRFIGYYISVLIAIIVGISIVFFAVNQESQVQGSCFLPGGIALQAYVPGRYMLYLDMDVLPQNEAWHLAQMRAIPFIVTEVKGAGHLNVLYPEIWSSGGLSRYIRTLPYPGSPQGDRRILIPFAAFDILWPGTYEIRASFGNGVSVEKTLISVAPASIVAESLTLSMLVFMMLVLAIWHKERKLRQAKKAQEKSYEVADS